MNALREDLAMSDLKAGPAGSAHTPENTGTAPTLRSRRQTATRCRDVTWRAAVESWQHGGRLGLNAISVMKIFIVLSISYL